MSLHESLPRERSGSGQHFELVPDLLQEILLFFEQADDPVDIGVAIVSGGIECLVRIVMIALLGDRPQSATLGAIVSIAVLDHVVRAANRAIAEQTPFDIFFGTVCPIVEHFGQVLRDTHRHQLVAHQKSSGQFCYLTSKA
jgi:hypothetical protein